MDRKDIQLYIIERNFKKTNIFDYYRYSKRFIFFLSSIGINAYINGIKNINCDIKKNIKTEVFEIAVNKNISYLEKIFEDYKIEFTKNKSNSLFIFYENIFYIVSEIIQIENNSIKIKQKILFLYTHKKLGIIKRKIKKIFNFSLMNKKLKTLSIYIIWLILKKLKLDKKAHNFRYKKILKDEFLGLKFMDSNILNILVRKKHFYLITDNFKLKTNNEIINYLSEIKNFKIILNRSKQPATIKLGKMPRHLDRKFWNNGNSYFLNSLIAGFREGITDYSSLTKEKDEKGNIVFSLAYYKSKNKMEESKIKRLLIENPINIHSGYILSGRHRVSAMIGRLIRGEKYIPFYRDRI